MCSSTDTKMTEESQATSKKQNSVFKSKTAPNKWKSLSLSNRKHYFQEVQCQSEKQCSDTVTLQYKVS